MTQTMANTKVRSSNLELYRIVTMFLIVCHHYVVNSGLLDIIQETPLSSNSLFYYIFGMWGKTGINCFVLITGYFMCKSTITIQKFLKLYLQIVFYIVVIRSIFWITGYTSFKIYDPLLWLLPFRFLDSGNFESCFILFWLLIPFLNILINNMASKLHLRLIALLLFIYTGLALFPKCTCIMNYVSWFSVLFIIASYVRKYPEYIYKSDSARYWGTLSIVSIALAVSSVVSILLVDAKFGMTIPHYHLVSDSNAIFALSVAFCTFMYFKNLNIKYNPILNAMGGGNVWCLIDSCKWCRNASMALAGRY